MFTRGHILLCVDVRDNVEVDFDITATSYESSVDRAALPLTRAQLRRLELAGQLRLPKAAIRNLL
jgi:hypothetical protein